MFMCLWSLTGLDEYGYACTHGEMINEIMYVQ